MKVTLGLWNDPTFLCEKAERAANRNVIIGMETNILVSGSEAIQEKPVSFHSWT